MSKSTRFEIPFLPVEVISSLVQELQPTVIRQSFFFDSACVGLSPSLSLSLATDTRWPIESRPDGWNNLSGSVWNTYASDRVARNIARRRARELALGWRLASDERDFATRRMLIGEKS